MELDDEVCLCFHVTKRKLLNYIRVEKPRRAGQLADCFGAGTGCGWCRGYLRRLFDASVAGSQPSTGSGQPSTSSGQGAMADEPTPEDYARARSKYIRAGGGVPPPGATPPVELGEDGSGEQESK
jgi:bacterioferritin-associated ferredoxin